MNSKIKLYTDSGGQFMSSTFYITRILPQIKLILFDWDGVFHSGYKNETQQSQFSEIDSMGINMLRFGFFLNQNTIPLCGIISGENNTTANFLAERENFNFIALKRKNKIDILPFIEKKYGITPNEIMFVFDDILDLSLAKKVGLRFLVNRKSNLGFIEYCKNNNIVDYITYSDGNNHAVREVTELCLQFLNKLDETIQYRVKFEGKYKQYIKFRQKITLEKV